MHTEVEQHVERIKSLTPNYFSNKKVLEVGSLNINGSVRKYFTSCNYTGIDIGEGPGVDKVIAIHQLSEPNTYDTLISTEMLEHDIHWKESLRSMYDNLKPKGLLILTCAGPTRQEHGTKRTTPGDSPYTTDYYRNITLEDFKSVLPEDLFLVYHLEYVRGDADLCFYGIKKGPNDSTKLQKKTNSRTSISST